MVEAIHDWKQTQFLHVFQQQLLTGKRLSPPTPPVPSTTLSTDRPSNPVPSNSRKGMDSS